MFCRIKVVTCLAVFMWEQLHHLWQKLRTEEQTWQMLFYLGINTLRRSFEVLQEDFLFICLFFVYLSSVCLSVCLFVCLFLSFLVCLFVLHHYDSSYA